MVFEYDAFYCWKKDTKSKFTTADSIREREIQRKERERERDT